MQADVGDPALPEEDPCSCELVLREVFRPFPAARGANGEFDLDAPPFGVGRGPDQGGARKSRKSKAEAVAEEAPAETPLQMKVFTLTCKVRVPSRVVARSTTRFFDEGVRWRGQGPLELELSS